VAHIITFGTMAARSSVRDVARVLDLPLPDADRIAKLVPETIGISLEDAFKEVKELREIKESDSLEGRTLQMAETLEGSVRNTGIHAAGVIIAPDKLTNYIPIGTAKDAELYVTQFDGKVIEDAGMLKMDFLGLKTLSILKTAIHFVKEITGKSTISMTFRWMMRKPTRCSRKGLQWESSSLSRTVCASTSNSSNRQRSMT
jgi:DNA polymerase III subunit alpha